MVQLFQRMDTRFEKLEKNLNEFGKYQEIMTKKQEEFEMKLISLGKTMKQNHAQSSKVQTEHSRILMQMAAGMGSNFEKYNADWLKKYLRAITGNNDLEIHVGYKELDINKEIHQNNTRVEIDLL